MFIWDIVTGIYNLTLYSDNITLSRSFEYDRLTTELIFKNMISDNLPMFHV